MTDLQRFTQLYDTTGIEYQLETNRNLAMILLAPGMKEVYGPRESVLCIVFEDEEYRHTEIFDRI